MGAAQVIPMDDYSPIFQGDTSVPFSPFIAHINGYEKLVGTDITMTMENVDTGEVKVCSGPWSIDPLDNGHASYAYQDEDVDTPGRWKMRMKIVNSDKVLHPDDGRGNFKVLTILALPDGA